MRRFVFGVAMVCLLAAMTGRVALAQGAATTAAAEDKTAPSYDMKAQAILDLQGLQKKFVELAQAYPQEKLTWRPGADVRSVSEVFLHVAGSNYAIVGMMGVPKPEKYGPNFDKSTTDKAAIVDELNKSFEHAIASVQAMSNADFAKALPKLGPQANAGDVVYILVTHIHEHLGQSIAYARENGIVPPWTAEAMKKAGKAPQD